LRRPLYRRLTMVACASSRLEVPIDQLQHASVYYASLDQAQQLVVIHPVKELFEIQVHHPLIAFRQILLGAGHCLMRGASWAKALTIFREGWVPRPLQDLQQGLLDEAVQDGGDPELP
jgi:site-specific DNA recombinase